MRKTSLRRINGGWGNWSEWSDCSTNCGKGIRSKQRECNNPVPENGGLFCVGIRKRFENILILLKIFIKNIFHSYEICEKKACSAGEPSFRAKQCSKFDNVPYQGGLYKWLPFFDKSML